MNEGEVAGSLDILKKVLNTEFYPEFRILLRTDGPNRLPIEQHIVNKKDDKFDYRRNGSVVCPKTCGTISVYNPEGRCTCGWGNTDRDDDLDRLLHFYYIHKRLSDQGREFPLVPECQKIVNKYLPKKKIPKDKVEGMVFYSIVPQTRLPFNDGEILKLTRFCEGIFTAKHFTKCSWVIESGKHENNPNLHIHCLGKLKNKNFKRMFITRWNKQYDKKYNIEYDEGNNKGWHMVPCNTIIIQKDKLKYMDNVNKGTHENFTDLRIGNKFGFEGGDSTTSQ